MRTAFRHIPGLKRRVQTAAERPRISTRDLWNAFTQQRELGVGQVPFAVKDNIAAAGFATTCASPLLVHSDVASTNAPVVTAVMDASAEIHAALGARGSEAMVPLGACDSCQQTPMTRPSLRVVGKTNMDAFGIGDASVNSVYGAVRNPLDACRSAGGSSGGSAAAVAAGLAAFALGTDTGGSVRQPAARCGLVGMRPGRGRVVRDGLVAYAPSMDTIGVVAPNVRVAAAVFRAMLAARGRDATWTAVPYTSAPLDSARTIRIGVCDTLPLAHGVHAALKRFAGVELVPVSVPELELTPRHYAVLASVEAASSLARFLVPRSVGREPLAPEALGPAAAVRVRLGRHIAIHEPHVLAAARAHAASLFESFTDAFASVDAIALPTVLCPTPPLLADVPFVNLEQWIAALTQSAPMQAEFWRDDACTVPASVAGLPALAMPVGCPADAPFPSSLQIVGPRHSEERLFAIASLLEQHISV